jgi:hypothetical protein
MLFGSQAGVTREGPTAFGGVRTVCFAPDLDESEETSPRLSRLSVLVSVLAAIAMRLRSVWIPTPIDS